MSVMLVVTVGAAAMGGFDWFIDRLNPSFGKVIELVEVYSEDQGIRMEVIGAQKYENKAIIYLSLQDITGQKRLTSRTDFLDGGFSVVLNETTERVGGVAGSGSSWSHQVLYFNEDTNTMYYELIVTADGGSPLADPLEFRIDSITLSEEIYLDESIQVSFEDIDTAAIISLQKEQIWGAWGGASKNPGLFKNILTPGYYVDISHEEKDQWVSNIGIVDGSLHVQIGKIFNKDFGSSDAQVFLKDSNGKLIPSDSGLLCYSDENNQLLNLSEHDYSDFIYEYEELIFSEHIEDFSGYSLGYSSSISSGVEGSWSVKIDLSNSNQSTVIWTNDIPVEEHLFEHITLSPLGLQVVGTYEGEECLVGSMVLEIETNNDVIPLEGGKGKSYMGNTFNYSWHTKTPIDVTTVQAIIINGTRILIK